MKDNMIKQIKHLSDKSKEKVRDLRGEGLEIVTIKRTILMFF
jgi:GTP cyclohydrolase II